MRNPNKKGKLTEAGILLESGEVVQGTAFELARKCQERLNENDYLGFEEVLYGKGFLEMEEIDFVPELKFLEYEAEDDGFNIFFETEVVFPNGYRINIVNLSEALAEERADEANNTIA